MAVLDTAYHRHFARNGRVRKEELELAKKLDGVFDIVYAGPEGNFSIWLANGTEAFRQAFGVDRQVAIVYSPYDHIDNRAVRALQSYTRRQEIADRVDHVLALVLHGAKPGEANRVCKRADDWVIVPLEINKVLDPKKSAATLINDAVGSRLRAADLFGMTSPLNADNYFFGRDDLIHDIVGRNELGSNNHGVFGLRKTGKTSVLYAVERRLAKLPVIRLYLDLASPGNHQRRWWSLLERIARKCAQGKPIKGIPGRGRYGPAQAAASFQEDMEALLDLEGVEQIILMFDEVEYITPGLTTPWGAHWDEDFVPFWSTIRGVHQETGHGLSFVVAGVNPKCTAAHSFDKLPNPIFQLVSQHLLEPFGRETVKEMVESIGKFAGVSFDLGTYDELLEACSGHPFLTRLACSAVARNTRFEGAHTRLIKREDFKSHREHIDARLTDPIKDILLSFIWWFPDDYELLEAVATGDPDLAREYFTHYPQAVDRLRRWGIIRGTKIGIPRIESYLREEGEAFRAELAPFVRSDVSIEVFTEPQDIKLIRRLNETRTLLEAKLRHIIYIVLGIRCRYNNKELANLITNSLNVRNGVDPGQLFIGTKPEDALKELYISDLKIIIDHNWDDFEHFFGVPRAKFDELFNIVIEARNKEAHLKSVSEERVTDYLTTYTWFHDRLEGIPLTATFREAQVA